MRKLAAIIDVPFIGCSNHKLNVAIEEMVRNDNTLRRVLRKVQKLMKKARTLSGAAKLLKVRI